MFFLARASLLVTACLISQICWSMNAASATIQNHDQSRTAAAVGQAQRAKTSISNRLALTPEFCASTLQQVDELVQKNFYDPKQLPKWDDAFKSVKQKALHSHSLLELSDYINEALTTFHCSHTQFVTTNDETYYFLKSLFARLRNGKPLQMDYVGAVTGGPGCQKNQVRYVLDNSPAESAGIRRGDKILSVDHAPYIGQHSFAGKSGKIIELNISRSGKNLVLPVRPKLIADAVAYGEASNKSVRVEKVGGKKLGYIHLWCGGPDAHSAIETALAERLYDTDGLILDLRDGYGGNFFDDLDFFYRPAKGYPPVVTTDRSGKIETTRMSYDRPLVALINRGSRSGKELCAYSLKQTGRAVLVGDNTAGAVLVGRFFDINDRCSLYLAVGAPAIGSINLEGTGVSPDIVTQNNLQPEQNDDKQLEEAQRVLLEAIEKSQKSQPFTH